MAKFVNKDLRLKDGQKVTFGDGLDVSLTFNGSEFGVDTVMSGIDPVQDHHLATKYFVDSQNALQIDIYEHGRQVIGDGVSTVSVVFSSALPNTNYTVNCTMENTSDSPPSIYAFIVSVKLNTGFTISMIGDTDSANYVLNWSVIS